jgi:hypothetical protein
MKYSGSVIETRTITLKPKGMQEKIPVILNVAQTFCPLGIFA